MNIEYLFDDVIYNEPDKKIDWDRVVVDKFRVKDIVSGDIIPFINQHYLMDPENFHFDKIDARESKINKQKIQKFLDDKRINISARDFIVLANFQIWFQTTYPDHGKYAHMRSATLKVLKNNHKNPTLLSEAFNRKIVMCTETSALAQMYLQHKGIQSVLYSGNAICNPNQDIQFGGNGHAWLMITLNGKKYFYDPANPIKVNNMLLPAIMDYSQIPKQEIHDFEEIIHKTTKQGGGFSYLEAKDIYGAGRHWLYGFEHGDDRVRTEHAVKRLPRNRIQRNNDHEM